MRAAAKVPLEIAEAPMEMEVFDAALADLTGFLRELETRYLKAPR
jgi:hypothetical protein